jgi:hypothetical protein
MTATSSASIRVLRGVARVSFAFSLASVIVTVATLARLPYAQPLGQSFVVVAGTLAGGAALLFAWTTVLRKPMARAIGFGTVVLSSIDAFFYGLLTATVEGSTWFFAAWTGLLLAYAAFVAHRLAAWPSSEGRHQPKSALGIFISYRRQDSRDTVGRIHDHLREAFDEQRIFLDVERQSPGDDYRLAIERALARAEVVLAVIGSDWLTAAEPTGRRRLDASDDMVRLELEAALGSNLRVVPVLIEGAAMPNPDDLPESLQELSYRTATAVRPDPDFRTDMARLIVTLRLPRELQPEARASSTARAAS